MQRKIEKRILEEIKLLCDEAKFPQVSILVGTDQSVRFDTALWVSKAMKMFPHTPNKKVSTIRDTLKYAHSLSHEKQLIFLDNVDKMSPQAKNTLLKTLEEPHKHCYYMLGTANLDKVPETLKSRCSVIKFSSFSEEELLDQINDIVDKDRISQIDLEFLSTFCISPHMMERATKLAIETDFIEYVEQVTNLLGKFQMISLLTITNHIDFLDGKPDKVFPYDLFMYAIGGKLTNILRYSKDLTVFNRCTKSLAIIHKYIKIIEETNFTKTATFDNFLMELNGVWVDESV